MENDKYFNNEYKIDNIILRNYNKKPYHNIEINLIKFLQNNLIDLNKNFILYIKNFYNSLSSLNSISINNNLNESNTNKNINNININIFSNENKSYFYKKIIINFSTILLIIEQINNNDFNMNLGIASSQEFPIEEDNQIYLLKLIQRTFLYQNFLNEKICKVLLNYQKIFFSKKFWKKNFFYEIYDEKLRLLYLQILYLISNNNYRQTFFNENFLSEIIDFYTDNFLDEKYEKKILVFEVIILCCIIHKLIIMDLSYIPIFLTKYFDKFFEISKKNKKIKFFVEMILSYILIDNQYGMSLNLLMKKDNKYNIFDRNLEKQYKYFMKEVNCIWRKSPQNFEEQKTIYKFNNNNNNNNNNNDKNKNICNNNYIKDFNKLNNDFISENKKVEFPLIPIEAVEYFNDDKSEVEINEILNYKITNDKSIIYILLNLLKENEKYLNEFDDKNNDILFNNENENIINEFNENLNDDEDNLINIFKNE